MNTRPGQQVNGQWTLIAETVFSDISEQDGSRMRKSVVLCVADHPRDSFVSWIRWVTFGPLSGVVEESFAWGVYSSNLSKALEAYNKRAGEEKQMMEWKDAIKARATSDGKAAASWLIDGTTSMPASVLLRWIKGIEDGDSEILDELPSPRLNGEYADDPTWLDVRREECEDWEDDNDDGDIELYDLYCEHFDNGVEAEIRRMYKEYAKETV